MLAGGDKPVCAIQVAAVDHFVEELADEVLCSLLTFLSHTFDQS